ncbi:MAG: B12-binding domain-containing radical SAM protein [Rhodospirillales bacterium]|nr:B12-binding domain-containing radical SAM protein [Rhodospirillales bacterium]
MNVLLVYKDTMIERLAVTYLSAALKAAGHKVRLAVLGPTPAKAFPKLVGDFAPRVIGYSAMTGEHTALLELNRTLKRSFDFLAVLGGPHATFRQDVLGEEGLDAICVGEGDSVFPEFCRRVEAGEAWWLTLTFHAKHDGNIFKNPLAPFVDMTALPAPDRAILFEAPPKLTGLGIKAFIAGRGCPYRCSYCFNAKFNEDYKGLGKVMRARQPSQVVTEIAQVRDQTGVELVAFWDDVFTVKPKGWVEDFCRLYKDRIGLPFYCNMRANSVNEAVVEELAKAGLKFVFMGVECGNERIANEILERNLSNEKVVAAARILQKHRVGIATQNLIGLPVPDPYPVDLETLDLNIIIKPTYAWSSILYPYPGTPIEAYARSHGFLDEDAAYIETNKRTTMLNFKSPVVRRRIENLHKLFGLVVRFPRLRPYVTFLCDLPLGGLYRVFYYVWYGYNLKFRLNRSRAVWRELPYLLGIFWRMVVKN